MSETTACDIPPEQPAGRLLLEISFDGSEYAGWQIQPHCRTVQEVLQSILSKLFAGAPIHLTGSSRTDAGVHALGFAASFTYPHRPIIPMEKLKQALNRLLPGAIRVRKITAVPLEFHARFDAVGKAYTYVLNRGEETPFSGKYSWHLRQPIDLAAIAAAAGCLEGTHDFSSFVVERKKIDDAVRTIYAIELAEFGDFICLTFKGNGFLYKMIRCLTGTLEAVGAGRLTPDEVPRILAARNRLAAPDTAPAHGLFLMKVFYQQPALQEFRLRQVPFFIGAE